MSLNQLIQDKYKPWCDIRVSDIKIDKQIQIAESDGSFTVDNNFGSIYPKADKQLYWKDEDQVEKLILSGAASSSFISEDSNAFPNQKRTGTQANNSVGLNSDLTTYSTTETGAANLGLVIGSEVADKLAQFVAIKHQDANEEPAYVMIRTRGTEAAQTGVQANDKIGAIYGISYNDNNVYEVNGILQFEAVSNQTATNADARFVVRLTETNNVTTSEAFIIDQDASIALRETVAPAALLGFGKIYVKSSTGLPYFKDASGTEYPLTGAISAETLQQTYDASLPTPEIELNANDPLIIKNDSGDVSQEVFGVYNNAETIAHLSVQKDRIIADGNIAVGLGTTNVSTQCIGIGSGSSANGIQSTSIGVGAQCGFAGSGSIALGLNANVQNSGSVAIGSNTTVNSSGSIVFNPISTAVTHNINNSAAFYNHNQFMRFETSDDRNTALNDGNAVNFTFSAEIPAAGSVVAFDLNTLPFRTTSVNNSFLVTIESLIYNKTSNSSIAEQVRSIAVATYRSDTTTLSVQPIVNISLITGDYTGSPTWTVNANNLEFAFPADLTGNEYHVVSDCKLMVCNVDEV